MRDWIIEELHRADSSDQETAVSRRKRSAVRDVCRKALDNINTIDNNFPILLDKLTFNLFSHYLTTCKNKDGAYQSKAGYGQIRSALKHLYRQCSKNFDDDYDRDLSQFMSGLKRQLSLIQH